MNTNPSRLLHITSAVFCVLGAISLPFNSHAAEAPSTAASEPNEALALLTETDDCKIFVALGRELLEWGKKAPDKSQFAIFYRPSGDGFIDQCPWKKLGVPKLHATKPDYANMRFFTQPRYSDDGRTATVGFLVRLQDPGRGSPFVMQEECILKKAGRHWKLKSCKLAGIT